MLYNLEDHLYPETISEVVELLQEPDTVLLAGGTGLSLERNANVKRIIDIQNLDLSYIRETEDHYKIGAMTPAYDIYKHENLPSALKYAAYCVGDTPILHAVTIGGNLAKFYPWVDLPPMLWALNASVLLYDPVKKIMSADEFFTYSIERNVYSRRALITEIQVPKPPSNSFSEFQTLMMTKNEKAQLNLASYFEWQNGKFENVRFVVSAATSYPIRLSLIERKLNGTQIESVMVDDLVDTNFDHLDFVSNYKSSIEYRVHILKVYLKRTLNKCRGLIKEEG